jgi:hypothetical protein
MKINIINHNDPCDSSPYKLLLDKIKGSKFNANIDNLVIFKVAVQYCTQKHTEDPYFYYVYIANQYQTALPMISDLRWVGFLKNVHKTSSVAIYY